MFVPRNDYILHWVVIVGIELVDPLEQVEEGILVRDIKQEDAAVRASVVRSSYSPKALLPGRVPQLKLHSFIFVIESPALAVNSNSRFIGFVAFVHCGPQKQRSFATIGVPNYNDLEEVIVRSTRLHSGFIKRLNYLPLSYVYYLLSNEVRFFL